MQTLELLSDPAYQNENAARLYIESVRWPRGPYCPKCGAIDRVRALGGESMGLGWYYCEACQDKFTVRVGSVFERSHIPLHKWLLAIRLMTSSKKGVSAHLHWPYRRSGMGLRQRRRLGDYPPKRRDEGYDACRARRSRPLGQDRRGDRRDHIKPFWTFTHRARAS
jgi:transposase-like protein